MLCGSPAPSQDWSAAPGRLVTDPHHTVVSQSHACASSSHRGDGTLQDSENLLIQAAKHSATVQGFATVNGDLLEALRGSASEAGHRSLAPWSFQLRNASMRLPLIRAMTLDSYLGPRQVLVLASVVRTERQPSSDELSSPLFSFFTLLPFLETLRMRGFTMRGSPESNDALVVLLGALQGHPTLWRLDLSESPVGPAVLPAVRKLLRSTPGLTDLRLTGCLLNSDELATVTALCATNRLRLKKATLDMGGAEALESARRHWAAALQEWAHGRALVLAPARGGTTAAQVPLVGQPPTPYVTAECDAASCGRLMAALYGPRYAWDGAAAAATGTAGAFSRDMSTADSDLDDAADGSSQNGSGSPHGYGSSVDAINDDNDRGPHSDDDDEEEASPTLTLPFLRYRAKGDDPHTLSHAAMEVLTSAFLPAAQAMATVLRGRPVPCGVPGPLLDAGPGYRFHDDSDRLALRAAVEASSLLTAVRGALFPPLPRPASIVGSAADNPELRSTDEEIYFSAVATQSRQWAALVDRLLSFARPAIVYPSRRGEVTVYEQGSAPYWLSFLPVTGASPGRRVAMLTHRGGGSDGSDSGGGGVTHSVCEGEFIGEADLLAGVACHTDGRALLSGSMATRSLVGGRVPLAHLVRQLQRTRQCTVVVSVAAGRGAAAAEPVLLWQLPRDVVFFFLYGPYQQLQLRLARSSRLGRHCGIPPVVRATVALLLRPHTHVRAKAREGPLGDAAAPQRDARVVADGPALRASLFLLEEGEYTLCTHTVGGKVIERPLLPGNVLLAQDVYGPDAEAREAAEAAAATAEGSVSPLLAGGAVLGKEALMRRYREAARHARAAMGESTATGNTNDNNQRPHSIAPGSAPGASLTHPRAEQQLRLGRGGAEVPAGTWRYFTMDARSFACLPSESRVALAQRCIVIDPS